MLIGSIIGAVGIADILYLIKTIKKYKKLELLMKFLKEAQHLNVSDLVKLFEKKQIGLKIPVIVRGLVKAKPLSIDRNIFSVITTTNINRTDQLKEYIFEKIPYKSIISKAFWVRPNDPKSISFNLQDINNFERISIQSCKNSDISGILTEAKTFEVKNLNGTNSFISSLKSILNSILFLNPFKFANKIGQKISYYGIMDNEFGYVIGQAKKRINGDIVVQNPQYITKQVSFINHRLKHIIKINRIALTIFLLFQAFLLYRLGKWLYRIYGFNIKFFQQEFEKPEQNVPFHQACIVCYSAARSVIFKPCKHYGVCYGCYERIGDHKNCPICKEQIKGIIQVIRKK